MNDPEKTQQQLINELVELRHRVEELVQEQSALKMAEKTGRVLAILSQKLSAAITPKDVALLVGEAADELLGWDAFFVNMYSETENLARSIINIDTVNGARKEFPSLYEEPGKPSPMLLRTLQEGAQLILRQEADGSDGPRLTTFGENSRRSLSLMFAPIREKGAKNIGLLSIQSYKRNAYDAPALELLQSLADQCSSALDRTFAEEKLRQSEKRNAILAALASQLNSIASVKEAGKVIVHSGEKALRLGFLLCNAIFGGKKTFSPRHSIWI